MRSSWFGQCTGSSRILQRLVELLGRGVKKSVFGLIHNLDCNNISTLLDWQVDCNILVPSLYISFFIIRNIKVILNPITMRASASGRAQILEMNHNSRISCKDSS